MEQLFCGLEIIHLQHLQISIGTKERTIDSLQKANLSQSSLTTFNESCVNACKATANGCLKKIQINNKNPKGTSRGHLVKF